MQLATKQTQKRRTCCHKTKQLNLDLDSVLIVGSVFMSHGHRHRTQILEFLWCAQSQSRPRKLCSTSLFQFLYCKFVHLWHPVFCNYTLVGDPSHCLATRVMLKGSLVVLSTRIFRALYEEKNKCGRRDSLRCKWQCC